MMLKRKRKDVEHLLKAKPEKKVNEKDLSRYSTNIYAQNFNNEQLWTKVEYIEGVKTCGTIDYHPIHAELKYGEQIMVLFCSVLDALHYSLYCYYVCA